MTFGSDLEILFFPVHALIGSEPKATSSSISSWMLSSWRLFILDIKPYFLQFYKISGNRRLRKPYIE